MGEETTEEVKQEVKEEVKEEADIYDIFRGIKNIMVSQQKEIEDLKKQIKDFKKPAEETETLKPDDLTDFKNDIKEMLQGYNRNNPNEVKNDTFEKTQMDILNRRF